ncbi:hypothetical protein GT352_28360 [Streptomyces sp. SID1046]|nr:hypothetical protein [Streptomyces sp. SID1046]
MELSDELIELQRAANQAREQALAGPYSREAWRPWLVTADALQAAVTEHAKATEQDRHKLEVAVKNAARQPADA